MSGWRIFWAVLAALCVFGVVSFFVATGVTSLAYDAAMDRVHTQIQARKHHNAKVAAARRRRQVAAKARDLASRRLNAHQRCVGGTVVDVADGAYVQRIQSGRPVACDGRMADVAIR